MKPRVSNGRHGDKATTTELAKIPSFRLDQITIATLQESEKLKITKIAEKLVEMNRKYTEVEYTLQTERAIHQEEIARIHSTIEGQVSIIEDRMRLKDEAIATLETKEHMLTSMLALYQAKIKNMVDISRLSTDTESYNKKKVLQLEADVQHFQVVINNQKKIIDSFEMTKEQLEEKMKSIESRHAKRVKSLEDMMSEEMDRKLHAEKSNMELSSENLLLKAQVQQLQHQLQLAQYSKSSSLNVAALRVSSRPGDSEYAAMYQSYGSVNSLRQQDDQEKPVKPQIVDYSPSRNIVHNQQVNRSIPSSIQQQQREVGAFPPVPNNSNIAGMEMPQTSFPSSTYAIVYQQPSADIDNYKLQRASHASIGSSILNHGGDLFERSIESSRNAQSTPQRKHYSLLSQITPDRRIVPLEHGQHNNTAGNHSHISAIKLIAENSSPPPTTVVKTKKKKKKVSAPAVLETTIDLSQDALQLSESQAQLQPPKTSAPPAPRQSNDNAQSIAKVTTKSTPPSKAVTFPHTTTTSNSNKEMKPLRTSSSSNNNTPSQQSNNKTIAIPASKTVVPKVEAKFVGKNGHLRIKKKESNGDQMKYDPKLFDLLDVLEQRDD